MLAASILVIGDEILGGFVEDSNSHWLAVRLREHGVPLTRVVTIPDEAGAIDEALTAELARSRPRVIFTSGGIGSTPDDITYEAVAASLERGLTEEPRIAEAIGLAVDWTRDHGVEVTDEFTEHLMRIARIPQGASLLRREGGWVPGVRVDLDGGAQADDGVSILILPGVPSEFRAIITNTVEPELLEGRNEPLEVRELTHGFPESLLNVIFARLIERYPGVKLGSYPGVPMIVRLIGQEDQVVAAMDELQTYVRELEQDEGGARLKDAWTRRFGAMQERN
ncbi:MAG TPA: molybdopterin-binding protein [Nitriliruptorales bacterium]